MYFIHHILYGPNKLLVYATVEDAVVVRKATRLDPEEYGPAYCVATIEVDEGETISTEPDALDEYLQNADWVVVED